VPVGVRRRRWDPTVTAAALLAGAAGAAAAALTGAAGAGAAGRPALWLVLGAAAGFATSGST
jgi:hypothetical protein